MLNSPRSTIADVYCRHCNAFDFIRFTLAAIVLWSHSYALLGVAADPIYAMSQQIDGGSLAVDAFFVLSGFLIVQSWLGEPSSRAYWLKRGLRIIPAMTAALMLGAFFVGPFVTIGGPCQYLTSPRPWKHLAGVVFHRYLAIDGAFVTNPLPGYMNTPLWSLRYEIMCYAGVAWLGARLSRDGRRWSVGLFAASWTIYAAAYALKVYPMSLMFTVPRLVACFSGGALIYMWRDRIPSSNGALVCALLILGAGFFWGWFRILFPALGAYALILWGSTGGTVVRRFGKHGDFSYGMYVFAYPVEQSIVYFSGGRIGPLALSASALAVTLCLAALSWHFLEAPALRLKGAIIGGAREVPAPSDAYAGARRHARGCTELLVAVRK